jgi:hypothetical protein
MMIYHDLPIKSGCFLMIRRDPNPPQFAGCWKSALRPLRLRVVGLGASDTVDTVDESWRPTHGKSIVIRLSHGCIYSIYIYI